MKSSSTTGLAYSFIPADSSNQTTLTDVDALAMDIIKQNTNLYLFDGAMPSAEILKAYTSGITLATDYSTKLIVKLSNFDVKYTYDKVTKTRKIQKFPVNAQTFSSIIDGFAGWACLELSPLSITSPYKCLIFTDAIGGWDDPDQSILVSNTTVVAGETITIKDVNITLRDAMLSIAPTI